MCKCSIDIYRKSDFFDIFNIFENITVFSNPVMAVSLSERDNVSISAINQTEQQHQYTSTNATKLYQSDFQQTNFHIATFSACVVKNLS